MKRLDLRKLADLISLALDGELDSGPVYARRVFGFRMFAVKQLDEAFAVARSGAKIAGGSMRADVVFVSAFDIPCSCRQ
jgi:hypothetical protein